ncbi:hypothetical protein ACSS31_28830 (plasmid) [Priestia megaterium]
MAGRKMKLTQDLIKEASTLLKAGNYTETVCQYLGIHKSTWYRWMAEGEKAKSGLKRDFYLEMKSAESYAEISNVNIVRKSAQDGNWQAAMTFLEPKFPERWGRKEKVSADLNHSGEVTEKKDYSITHKIEEYQDAYEKVAQRAMSLGEDSEDDLE